MNRFVSLGLLLGSGLSAFALKEYLEKRQFYLVCLSLAQSNASYSIIIMFVLYLMACIAFLLMNVFFGLPLRAIELEHLNGHIWYTMSETFLIMTIFRDEFNSRYVILFTAHFIVKLFHWVAADRIDYMDQTPTLSTLFHVRMGALLIFLEAINVYAVQAIVQDFVKMGPSMMLLFGFEFSILAVSALTLMSKYIIYWVISSNPQLTDNKSMYIFYLELATDFIKLVLYVAFFWLVMTYYGLPLHIIRDLYLTLRSFVHRVRDVLRYRMATANMNDRYPIATQEELDATDKICIICREEMDMARKLPCGHLFHFQCLRSWLERQQVCPTCRRSVLVEDDPVRDRVDRGEDNANPNPNPNNNNGVVGENNERDNVPFNPAANNSHPQTADIFNDLMGHSHSGLRLEPLISLSSSSASVPLESLTDSQLADLETKLRGNVIKRLEFLQGIQQSINNIQRQFGRYQNVIERIEITTTATTTTNTIETEITKTNNISNDSSSSSQSVKGKEPMVQTSEPLIQQDQDDVIIIGESLDSVD